MRKHFFCARNIEDYRAIFSAGYGYNHAAEPHLEQNIFLRYLKDLYNVPDFVLDSQIVGDTGIDGLRLDFNFGLRLDVPQGNFRVVISDADTDEIFFNEHVSDVRLISAEKNFIRWKVAVFLEDKKIFSHTLNLEGRPVTIMFVFDALGDALAFLPVVREFMRRHRCEMTVCLPKYIKEFAAHMYPEFKQIDQVDFHAYATYYLTPLKTKIFFFPANRSTAPVERFGTELLGLGGLVPNPTFKPTMPPVTSDPYVCIGVQASTTAKGWLYPNGWDIVIDYLKSLGYRVFCIDKHAEETNKGLTIRKPVGAEDFTGDISIMERANMLYHAEFFIGLSSGLAWLANAVDCPVVMISGFSKDWYEFSTPYRVANRLVCNGCFNDLRLNFFEPICPIHNGTPRELECQKKISPRQVLDAIERLIVDRNLTPPVMRDFP